MTKSAKRYGRYGIVRQMTMEMVESQQDESTVDSLPDRDAVHDQSQPGESHISSVSQKLFELCRTPIREAPCLFLSEEQRCEVENVSTGFASYAQVSVAASSAGRGSPAVTLVQLPSGQTVHVQGVIQATQPSVIQSPQMQAVQVASIADESAESEEIIDSQKRREILSRRPSYRKILNELSSDTPAVPKIEEEKSEEEGAPSGISPMSMPTSLYQTSSGQYIAITQGGTIQISNPPSDGVRGLQALTMTNSGAPQPGATIVQYAAHSPDGTQQFFVPGNQVVVQAATGDMPAYQLRTPTTTLPQGVVMAASPGTLHSPQQLAEEATRKRELRLMKNREAAKECRRRKKEYIKCLESRVAVLEVQNKKLIEELETLKAICSSKTD
ncbi:cAMP-responsive element modulator isoform X2 [Oxyura jamaicensis]|uniref:cAMP-responsive element modulator isoform X2 n=1 Tax=Oxyura jamaicensis TaxID=8884 RepID=UPI0015A6DADB|nr:cAMP-responsive element modulator isoform X2 [Oxyura jamaicensis]